MYTDISHGVINQTLPAQISNNLLTKATNSLKRYDLQVKISLRGMEDTSVLTNLKRLYPTIDYTYLDDFYQNITNALNLMTKPSKIMV